MFQKRSQLGGLEGQVSADCTAARASPFRSQKGRPPQALGDLPYLGAQNSWGPDEPFICSLRSTCRYHGRSGLERGLPQPHALGGNYTVHSSSTGTHLFLRRMVTLAAVKSPAASIDAPEMVNGRMTQQKRMSDLPYYTPLREPQAPGPAWQEAPGTGSSGVYTAAD